MLYKYLKLILFSTLILQASPKVFNSLGNELESFQGDCKGYQEISFLPKKVKKQCDLFNSKVNSAFKVGYELNPESDISEKKLTTYLALLRKLEGRKKNILNLIYSEAKKARKQNNTKYYSLLIKSHILKLYSSDYEFMEKNQNIFSKNERYTSHVRYLKSLEEARKPIAVVPTPTKKKKISPPKNNNYFITSIKRIVPHGVNTDSDPRDDDLKIYIVFGNSQGADVEVPMGIALDYTLTISRYTETDFVDGGRKVIIGEKLASSSGKLRPKHGSTQVFIKMPELTATARILIHTLVTLPNGVTLENKDKTYFGY